MPAMPSQVSSLLRARKLLIDDPPALSVDGDVPYREGWAVLVPRCSGVYLIRDLRGMLYVGKAINLRRRFDQHRVGSHNARLCLALARPVGQTYFCWVEAADPSDLEALLIARLQPLCNERLLTA